jgi:uncharacterized membrane protein YhaH (DUF805 family)
MHLYLDVFKNHYVDFHGRASRKEYWMYTLFHFIVVGALYTFFAVTESSVIAGVLMIYFLASIVPSVAITVRRLHDIGKSGWAYLFGFIPLFGSFILLIFACMKGQPNHNLYGPNPKFISNNSPSQNTRR